MVAVPAVPLGLKGQREGAVRWSPVDAQARASAAVTGLQPCPPTVPWDQVPSQESQCQGALWGRQERLGTKGRGRQGGREAGGSGADGGSRCGTEPGSVLQLLSLLTHHYNH